MTPSVNPPGRPFVALLCTLAVSLGTAVANAAGTGRQRPRRSLQDVNQAGAHELADDPSSPIAKCVVTATQPCDYAFLRENLPAGKNQWFVVPGGDTKCLDEDSPYGFGVFLPPDAADAVAPSRLMIWFTGGGACYDYETCVTTPTATLQVYAETGGYFNYALANNPLRDGGWAAVTIGYCSGDMHVGDAVVELVDKNATATTKTVSFSGYNNTLSVMEWIQRQPEFDTAAAAADGGLEVAGAGCSAGSLGVQLWADYLVREMGVSKLQPDSYIGMLPKGANEALNIWNACKVAADIGIMNNELERKCKCPTGLNCLHTMTPIVLEFLAKYPTLPVAYTGSAHDIVQVGYYALLASSFSRDGVGFNAAFAYATLNFPTFEMDALALYGNVSSVYSNYIVDTNQHCFVPYDATFADEGAPSTTSAYAECVPGPADGDCAERESMGAYVSAFLNGNATDNRTPRYPESFPSSWHILCEKAADVCGLDFPPGDGSSAPTEEQLAWLDNGGGQEVVRRIWAALNAHASNTAADDTAEGEDTTKDEPADGGMSGGANEVDPVVDNAGNTAGDSGSDTANEEEFTDDASQEDGTSAGNASADNGTEEGSTKNATTEDNDSRAATLVLKAAPLLLIGSIFSFVF